MLTLKAFYQKYKTTKVILHIITYRVDLCFMSLVLYDEYKFKPVFYRGENSGYKFLNNILKVGDKISFILNQNQEMIVTKK